MSSSDALAVVDSELTEADTALTSVVLLSDIHGNLPALQAVVESLPPYQRAYVIGDHCLEGSSPAEVFDLLHELGWTLLLGNTDQDILFPPRDPSILKSRHIAWTREQIGAERLRRLAALAFSARLTLDAARILMVHANPRNLHDKLHPSLSEEDLAPYLADIEADILAFGHLHTPYIRPVSGILLVDVSSVGQPKDGDLRASYTVLRFLRGSRSVEQIRVPYDVDRTIYLLRHSDMPGASEQVASLLKASY